MHLVPDSWKERAQRLQPDLDETAVQAQLITIFPTAASIAIGIVLVTLSFIAGLPSIAYAFLAVSVSQAISFIIGSARPQFTIHALFGFALVGIGANFYIHAVSGGFTSGLWSLAWLMIVPLAIYFVGGQRIGAFALLLAMGALIAAVLFEKRFAASPVVIPIWLILVHNFITLSSVLLMGYIWADFLISQLELARRQADALLLNVLPKSIAARLKAGEATIADRYDSVTVLFADIVDFTTMSSAADPVDVVNKLNEIFSDFDELAAQYGLEKIKTIGDAYMVAGGLPEPRDDHVEAVAAFAVDVVDIIGRHQSWTDEPIRLRVGINTGPIVAGVIGRQKFIYDLWGDAVNVASRMESNGLANQIQVTAAVRERLDGRYVFDEREPIFVKGKGQMITYLLSAIPTTPA
ncbi:MAG: adenylate/guanylate cyclase domain-containing protein [Candidatus Promineofilum sp.]|uniref:adenylate/guanylate cyclase domain-containing protein n=1 Tax=Promineifilum sp. TaxID=2664178 RepID=UPI002411D299|nr:adenylate/guanylate cyclase domain-containing protein [Promineifilum sp.]